MDSERRRTRKPRYERRIFALALATGVPAAVIALFLLWLGDFAARTQWTLTILLVVVWLAFVAALWERVVRPLQTISNMLAALREGDFSLRARGSDPNDALGLLFLELNSLGEDLRAQRLSALEATALLRRVMEEIDVAVFAFDEARALRLVNRGGAALLGRPAEQLLGKDAAELGLADTLAGDAPRVLEIAFPGRAGQGRWEVRRGTFRQRGLPHQLLVLADVSRALSEEERQAWQRLIRVLSHELNNSLAPIKSIAQSLAELVRRDPPPLDWRDDLQKGLGVIGGRAESLSRLMAAYARLARLPRPRLEPVVVAEWVRRVVALETRRSLTVCPGPERGRGDPRERRSRRARVDGARRPRGCVGSRRGPWPGRHRQPVRAVLHYQGRRVRDRARALASDCRGARRDADAREPRWAGLRSSAVLTDPQRRARRPTQRGGGALGAAART